MATSLNKDTLCRAAAGDTAAWQDLLQTLHGPLVNFVQPLIPSDLKSLIDPQDVLNDTYFDAYRRLPEFQQLDETSIFRWLATIARHRLTDLVRANRALKRGGGGRQIEAVRADPAGSLVDLLHELAVYERTPSKSVLRREIRVILEASIARLSAPLREAVRLRHLAQMSYSDVAARMRRTERAVQQLCVRALQQLRQDLESASFSVT